MIGDRFFVRYGNEIGIFGFLRLRWNFRAENRVSRTLRWGEPGFDPYFLFGTFLFRK
jgi:hypothetical protein